MGIANAARTGRTEIVTIAICPAGHTGTPRPSDASATGRHQPTSRGSSSTCMQPPLGGSSLHGGRSAPGAYAPGLPPSPAAVVAGAMKELCAELKRSLEGFGSVLLLNSTSINVMFPTASDKLDVLFYRSKITSWMARQEEEYRWGAGVIRVSIRIRTRVYYFAGRGLQVRQVLE